MDRADLVISLDRYIVFEFNFHLRPVPPKRDYSFFRQISCPKISRLLASVPSRVETFFFRFWGPSGGPGISAKGAQRAISAKKPSARSVFFRDFRGNHENSAKMSKSTFYLSESTIFRTPGGPNMVPWGTPGRP